MTFYKRNKKGLNDYKGKRLITKGMQGDFGA